MPVMCGTLKIFYLFCITDIRTLIEELLLVVQVLGVGERFAVDWYPAEINKSLLYIYIYIVRKGVGKFINCSMDCAVYLLQGNITDISMAWAKCYNVQNVRPWASQGHTCGLWHILFMEQKREILPSTSEGGWKRLKFGADEDQSDRTKTNFEVLSRTHDKRKLLQ